MMKNLLVGTEGQTSIAEFRIQSGLTCGADQGALKINPGLTFGTDRGECF